MKNQWKMTDDIQNTLPTSSLLMMVRVLALYTVISSLYMVISPLCMVISPLCMVISSSEIYAQSLNAPSTSSIPSLDLQGHRGARGLYPENTLPAFKACMALGMNTIELDTTLTQDDQLIVYHDTMINPHLCQHRDGSKLTSTPILNLSSQWITSLDCGSSPHPRFPEQKLTPQSSPPLLSEVFKLERSLHQPLYQQKSSPRPRYNIEIKVDQRHQLKDKKRAITALISILDQMSVSMRSSFVQRITIQSFDREVLEMLHKEHPQLRRSALFEPTYLKGGLNPKGDHWAPKAELIKISKSLNVEVISPYFKDVTSRFIQHAHAHGLSVVPWTVNDPKDIESLIRLGVDGVISDYPNRLMNTVKKMGPQVSCRVRFSDLKCTSPLTF